MPDNQDTPHDPDHGKRSSAEPRRPRQRSQLVAALIVLLLALLVTALLLVPTGAHQGTNSATSDTTTTATPTTAPVVLPQPVADLAALPESTTFTAVAGPADLQRDRIPSGRVVHPNQTVPVYEQPGGSAIAALPTQQISSDTWLPVIAEEPGWVQVLLPSRPNGSTGWLSTQDSALDFAQTPYRIEVNRAAFRMQLYRGDQLVGSWTVGIGKPGAETPAGRTFVLASLQDRRQTFSPVILPLGSHSDSHETYGGGPGTTGIHGWPSTDVFGRQSSDGCIRVPADALHVLSADVPLGTPVLIC